MTSELIALPGQNKKTLPWMQELVSTLETAYETSTIQHYRHWQGEFPPLVVHEAALLNGQTPRLVVAKSVGTLVAMRAYAREDFHPERAVFIGVPLRGFVPQHLKSLQNFCNHIPTLCIQQTNDAYGSFSALSQVVQATSFCTLAEVSGQDHMYEDVPELTRLITDWLKPSA